MERSSTNTFGTVNALREEWPGWNVFGNSVNMETERQALPAICSPNRSSFSSYNYKQL